MLYHFSNNYFKRIGGIAWYNRKAILLFVVLAHVAYILERIMYLHYVAIPVIPVTILGGGLAIFLAIRNNAAYDRWWEARKIWGAIVNSSRHLGSQVMTYLDLQHKVEGMDSLELHKKQERMIRRHIAWLNALRHQLRERPQDLIEIKTYLEDDEYEEVMASPNKATMINHFQSVEIADALRLGLIDVFRHMDMMRTVKDFYEHQGKCERIKKTVFPYYYTYFTGVFLWLFIVLLPFALVGVMNYVSVPLSIAISFSFYILDKTGNTTEDPFENRATDIPMTALCRTIEIDMLRQLGETELPKAIESEYTRFGAEFLR